MTWARLLVVLLFLDSCVSFLLLFRVLLTNLVHIQLDISCILYVFMERAGIDLGISNESVAAGILVNGVGLSLSVPVCSLGIYACIIFYAGSKVSR